MSSLKPAFLFLGFLLTGSVVFGGESANKTQSSIKVLK